MKRFRLLIVSFIALMLCASASCVSAAVIGSGEWGAGPISWVLDDGGTLTLTGSGEMPDYASIQVPWDKMRDQIRTVKIGDGITGIGNNCFLKCGNLTSVTMPAGLTRIGNSAFELCGKLTGISVPDSVTFIDQYAFHGCGSLTAFRIPAGLKKIEDSCFYDCSGLVSITIPEGVTKIGDLAFNGCSALKSISIPDSVTGIGSGVFSNCSALTTVKFPAGLKKITHEMFYNCTSLKQIVIPGGVQRIEQGAFSCCSALTAVYIPKTVARIEKEAFYKCDHLKTIYFEGSKTRMKQILAEVIAGDDYAEDVYDSQYVYNYDISKKANPLTVKGKTVELKHSKVKKKKQSVKCTKALKISSAKGTLKYKLQSVSKSKYKKYFSVNSKTGTITVKKGLKKGTYKLYVKVTAAGDSAHNAVSKSAAVKIKVR